MSAPQQKCVVASKPTAFAALLSSVKATTPAATGSTSSTKRMPTPSKAANSSNRSPMATGSAPSCASSSSLSDSAPYTRLPRPIPPPSKARRNEGRGVTHRPVSHSLSDHGSLNYGTPDGVVRPTTRASIPPEAHQPPSSSPSRLPRPTGDFYRPGPRSRSPRDDRGRRDTESGRVAGSHRPGYYSTSTNPPQRSRPRRDQVIPPWAQRESHEVDRIIAELEKKAVPKSRATSVKIPEPQRRAVDTYRPTQKRNLEPKRLNDYNAYYIWNKDMLLRELKLRQLQYENEDHPYLVNVLIINDQNFFEKCQEFGHLHTAQVLLEEAKFQNVFIDESKGWERYALITEIADQLARNAVSQHNDLLRAEQVAHKVALRKQASPAQARPSNVNSAPKVFHKGVKVKDRAKYKMDPWADTQEKASESAKKDRISKSGSQKNFPERGPMKTQRIAPRKTKAADEAETTNRVWTSKDGNSQGSDSGYLSSRFKTSTSPTESASTQPDDEMIITSAIDQSKKRITLCNRGHEVMKTPADEGLKEHTKGKKRARPLELEKETKDESPKRVKVKPIPKEETRPTIDKADRLKPNALVPSERNGQMKIDSEASKPEPQPTKAGQVTDQSPKEKLNFMGQKATLREKEVKDTTAIARKTSQKRKSRADEDTEDSQQSLSKKVKRTATTTPRPKKALKGIPGDERIPGMMYIQCADGSYELKKRKKAVPRVSDPVRRFVK